MSKGHTMRNMVLLYAGCCIVILIASFFLMKNRAVVYATDVTLEKKDVSFKRRILNLPETDRELLDVSYELNTNRIVLPVHENLTENRIALLEDEASNTLTVYIDTLSEGFYEENRILADKYCVRGISTCYQDGVTRLTIQLNGVYRFVMSKEGSGLTLELYTPEMLYDHVVLLSAEEEESGILEKIREALENVTLPSGMGIWFYEDLKGENYPTPEAAANAVGAEAVVILALHASEDGTDFGISAEYNERLYLPTYTGQDLGDTLIRSLCEALNERGTKLSPAIAGDELDTLSIPACRLFLGYTTNEKEKELLLDTEYENRLALALVNGLGRLWTVTEETE